MSSENVDRVVRFASTWQEASACATFPMTRHDGFPLSVASRPRYVDALRWLWQRWEGIPLIARQLWAQYPCPAEFVGATPTVRRWVNYARLLWSWYHTDPTLAAYPARLCIEASSACNLDCPYCFTGAGERSRERATLTPAFFTRLLDEMGAYLWQVEFHNWGEPLLNKHLLAMITEAHNRGLSTTFNTNFSLPFDAARAEALVHSGLTMLGVSIDGARQSSYEQYRVKGRLELVLQNCRLVADAKRRLGSATPRMVWSFHLFAFNVGDVADAHAQATALGMEFHVARGRVVGPDWDPEERFIAHERVHPMPCYTLFHTAVMYGNGSVAPCRGSYYAPDDMGRVGADGRPGASSFKAVWNNERFRVARRLFTQHPSERRQATASERRRICFECPTLLDWRDFVAFRMRGGTKEEWVPPHDGHFRYNYFWQRKYCHEAASSDAAARAYDAERDGVALQR
jgi:pyruvate-formate lyase-activating enzyme